MGLNVDLRVNNNTTAVILCLSLIIEHEIHAKDATDERL